MPAGFILKQTSLKVLIIAWMLMAGIHAFLDFLVFDYHWQEALPDIIGGSLLFVVLAIGLNHFISARTLQTDTSRYHILQVLLVTLSLAVIWVIGCNIIMYILQEFSPVSSPAYARSSPLRLFTGMLVYTILGLVFYIQAIRLMLANKETHAEDLRKNIQETELSLLQAQINPHFLFNSLNSLASLTITNPAQAHEMIIILSDYLRMGLHKPTEPITSLKNELENCHRYLAIEKMRFGKRMELVFDTPDGCAQASIPHTILQPLYENAIKYGVGESSEAVTITTRCCLRQNILEVEISNDIPDSIPSRKGKGMGLNNIRRRLELYYNQSGLIQIRKESKVFSVVLTIPQFPKSSASTN